MGTSVRVKEEKRAIAAPANVLRRSAMAALGLVLLALAGWLLAPVVQGHLAGIREELALRHMDDSQLGQEIARLRQEVAQLRTQNERLEKEARQRLPAAPYIVVDTQANALLVRDGQQVLRQAVCSTGSGQELKVGRRRWVFNTPKGRFKVLAKHYLPIWIKPDWAFYEEGKRPPPANSPQRFEEAVLGEYALSFGDGYLIHGTLYKRLLGKSVTHGCVRLDDEDLRFVHDIARVGTGIYIF
jgi:L,D-transpeptidase YbiS